MHFFKEGEKDTDYKFYGWNHGDVPAINREYGENWTPCKLYDVLSGIWCQYTCAPRLRDKWSEENKTAGQCSITAFLAQDIFGGKVYGIPLPGGNTHCYNVVNGCVFDLTSEQFGEEKLNYENNPEQLREVHFAKEEKRLRYEFLKNELKKHLAGSKGKNIKMTDKTPEKTLVSRGLTALVGEPLYEIWGNLCALIEDKYDMERIWGKGGKAWTYEYKYRRGGKTLCALYARENAIGFMIIFGKHEREKFEQMRGDFSEKVQNIYDEAKTYHDGKWVMFEPVEPELFEDFMKRLAIKRRGNRKGLRGRESDIAERGDSV